MKKLFEPVPLKDAVLKNRVIMPPMCMYCAEDDGAVTPWHVQHYGTRAVGGAALIIQEATGIAPNGRISGNDLGIWDEGHVDGLKKIVAAIQSGGALAGIQINHGGRKCEAPGQKIIAPSPLAFDEKSAVPREMTEEDIEKTVEAFKQAAKRARLAGYDVLEVHAAHGYLLSEFLSPLTNRRTDRYGGSAENRARILLEVLDAVKTVWPAEKPLLVRVSAEDYGPGGNRAEDLAEIISLVRGKGVDLVDVSTGGVIPAVPKAFQGYQIPHARTIRERTGLPVIGGGKITDPAFAQQVVEEESADLVYLGRELLRNPYWPLNAAGVLGQEIRWPRQYQRAKPE